MNYSLCYFLLKHDIVGLLLTDIGLFFYFEFSFLQMSQRKIVYLCVVGNCNYVRVSCRNLQLSQEASQRGEGSR